MPAVVRRLPAECGPSTDRRGFRFRLVADASGAPVLGDQVQDRLAGHGKAMKASARRAATCLPPTISVLLYWPCSAAWCSPETSPTLGTRCAVSVLRLPLGLFLVGRLLTL